MVPAVRVEKIGDKMAMLIQRFDRYWDVPDAPPIHAGADALALCKPEGAHIEKRLGFVSGLTLLGCHEADAMNKSYGDLPQAIRKHCHPAVLVADNKDLFRRMVYNIFVTNNDDLWPVRLNQWDNESQRQHQSGTPVIQKPQVLL